MKPSFQLFALGVGAWMAVGSVSAASAQPRNPQAQPDPEPPAPTPIASIRALQNSGKGSAAQRQIGAPRLAETTAPKNRTSQSAPRKPSIFAEFQARKQPTKFVASTTGTFKSDAMPAGAMIQLIAQEATPRNAPSAPLPSAAPSSRPSTSRPNNSPTTTPQSTTTPSPATAQPNSTIPSTATPATASPTTVIPETQIPPSFLNPNPNPLRFPTQPGEVRIRATQRITLRQAIDAAERKNQTIGVARLQLERSQFALREARAANFPTLSLSSTFTRAGDAFIGGGSTSGLSSGGTTTGTTTGLTGTTTTGTTTGVTGTTTGTTTGLTGTTTTGTTTTGTTTGTTTTGTTTSGAAGTLIPSSSASPTATVRAAQTEATGTTTTGTTGTTATGATVTNASGLTGTSSTSNTLTAGLTLSYNIYTSGLVPSQIRAAERQVRSSELALEQSREALRLQVTTAYYNVQNADSQVAINEAAVRNAQAGLNDARAQEAAGLGTRFATLQAAVNLANAVQQLRNAQATQEVNRRQLAQVIDAPQTATLVAADPVTPAGTWTLSLEDSIVLAFRNRAELESFVVQREISQEQLRQARAGNGPTLAFTASYQYQRSNTLDTSPINGDGYSFALRANMNLFDGGATQARIAQQQRNIEIAEVQFAQQRNQVRFDVEQAYAQLQANLANISTTTQAVTEAEESLRLAVLRFQAGVGTQTDRIAAEAALTQAQGNQVAAIIGYNLSLAQLQRAVSNVVTATTR